MGKRGEHENGETRGEVKETKKKKILIPVTDNNNLTTTTTTHITQSIIIKTFKDSATNSTRKKKR